MPLKPKAGDDGMEEQNAQMERIKKLETQVSQLLRESVFAGEEGDTKKVSGFIFEYY
jgi:hypothetical protein